EMRSSLRTVSVISYPRPASAAKREGCGARTCAILRCNCFSSESSSATTSSAPRGEGKDQDDFGSESSMVTVKAPDLIASSLALTLLMTSAGTLPSKVPSGDRLQPPNFMKEYWP